MCTHAMRPMCSAFAEPRGTWCVQASLRHPGCYPRAQDGRATQVGLRYLVSKALTKADIDADCGGCEKVVRQRIDAPRAGVSGNAAPQRVRDSGLTARHLNNRSDSISIASAG